MQTLMAMVTIIGLFGISALCGITIGFALIGIGHAVAWGIGQVVGLITRLS